MKLFILKLLIEKFIKKAYSEGYVGEVVHGMTIGIIIKAENEDVARKICSSPENAGCGSRKAYDKNNLYDSRAYDDRDVWLDPEQTSCVELTSNGEAGIIMCEND